MELSQEKSTEQAYLIKAVEVALASLDYDYLHEVYQQLKHACELQESASVLGPPSYILQHLAVTREKVERLRLIIQLGQNMKELKKKEMELQSAKESDNVLKRFFNL